MKILLFGTGDCYQKYKRWFKSEEIVALLDNDDEKLGSIIDGKTVMLPDKGIQTAFDFVYILSVYEREIRQQLLELGVPDHKIRHYYDIAVQLKPQRKQFYQYGNLSGSEAVLFLFYDLNYNGASIALYHVIQELCVMGKHVVAASINDGILRDDLLCLGVPVIIDANLQIDTFQDIPWAQQYSIVFCNTVNFYWLLSQRSQSTQFIWWLHEPELFYAGIQENVFRRIDSKNLTVYAAGQIAADAYHRFRPKDEVKIFLYGLPDYGQLVQKITKKSKIKFAVIGNLQVYKAQDIYLSAIKALHPDIRKKAIFYVVGGGVESKYAMDLRQAASTMQEVIFLGAVDYKEIHKLLDSIDVLICPSRQDTMPTVVAEGMMHGVLCLISNQVGTASLIKNGEEGIIFKCENVNQLALEISKCINGQYDLKAFGKRARAAYQRLFSINALHKRLIQEFPQLVAESER